MRVLLSSDHRYPAFSETGVGLRPKLMPSGSGYMIHDLLAKGLGELGHDVLYLLRKGADKPLPAGVTLVSEPVPDADVLHAVAYHDEGLVRERQSSARPWVATCHLDLSTRGLERSATTENWIFVSRTLARLHGRERFVLNGIDPSEYIFSEVKDDYLMFMSTMDWQFKKGLDVALHLSR